MGIEGNFPIHKAVVEGKNAPNRLSSATTDTTFIVMPRGTNVLSAESCGMSTWTKTAKVSVILPGGDSKRYFLKVKKTLSSLKQCLMINGCYYTVCDRT